MTRIQQTSGVPLRGLVLAAEHVESRLRAALLAMAFGGVFALAAVGLEVFVRLLPDGPAVAIVHATQLGLLAVAGGWGVRGAWLRHKFGAVKDKPTSAALVLAKHQNPALERALFAIDQQGRSVTRIEAAWLLKRHYRDF